MGAPPPRDHDGAQDGAPSSTRPARPARPAASSSAAARDLPDEPATAAAPGRASDDGLGADGAAPSEGASRLTRRRLIIGALLAAVCAVVAIVLVSGGHGKGSITVTGVPAGETTATVTRRTLTESSTVDGTLGYGATLELYDRLSGTYTWLPAVGATIAAGGTLFRIDNLPVVLMYGTVPAYRPLEQGVSGGPDVEELNRNLIDLGYDPYGAITDLESFGEATAAAVRRWQKAERLPETGRVQLGRVVFAPSARRVTTVHVALGQDPTAAELPAGGEGDETPPEKAAGSTEKAPSSGKGTKPGGNEAPASGGKPKSHKPDAQGHGKPGGNEAANKDGKSGGNEAANKDGKSGTGKPAESSAHDAADDSPSGDSSPSKDGGDESSKKPEGGTEGAGEVVLTTTSTEQLVQLKLKAEQQQLAHVGERAPVTLPGGGVVQGTITEVGTVASEAKAAEGEKGGSQSEGSGESTIPVTLELAHPVPHLDQAPVSVELVRSVSRNVLAVPATALTATAGGGYSIEVLERNRRVQLSVTPGMFANGYVGVEGARLHEGQTVIESE